MFHADRTEPSNVMLATLIGLGPIPRAARSGRSRWRLAFCAIHSFLVFTHKEAYAQKQPTRKDTEDSHVDTCHAENKCCHGGHEKAHDHWPDEWDKENSSTWLEDLWYEGHFHYSSLKLSLVGKGIRLETSRLFVVGPWILIILPQTNYPLTQWLCQHLIAVFGSWRLGSCPVFSQAHTKVTFFVIACEL